MPLSWMDAWRQDVFERIRPVIGLSVALTYFFAGFHKLNSDFFDYEAGRTHTFMLTILQFYLLPVVDHLPETFVLASSIVVVLWELVGSFAFFVSSAQPYMLLFSLQMLLILANCHFYDFSSMLFACFTVFMPDSYWKLLNEHAGPRKQRQKSKKSNFESSHRYYWNRNLLGHTWIYFHRRLSSLSRQGTLGRVAQVLTGSDGGRERRRTGD
jgi:hypothetical protein